MDELDPRVEGAAHQRSTGQRTDVRRGTSVGTKLTAVVVALVALAAVLAGGTLVRRERAQLLESKVRVAKTLVEQVSLSVAPAVEFADDFAVQAAVEQASQHPGVVAVDILDAQGTSLAKFVADDQMPEIVAKQTVGELFPNGQFIRNE